jgi:hypothetical protein
MGIITNRHLPRRTFLRGIGATIALPLLDGMIPAFGARARAAAVPVRRLGAVYVPNGMNMNAWTPAAEGAGFELAPILQSLAPVRNRIVVLSGLACNEANQRPGEGAGDHSRAAASFLSGVHAKRTEGADIRNGITMDQIAAQEFGKHTQLASLELGLEANEMSGGCEQGYSCAYGGTISWRSATTPLPMENDPRAVFERLFGASQGTDKHARVARLQRERSILDSTIGALTNLGKRLGPGDRTKLDQYLESVRSIERRIQVAEAQQDRELPEIARPAGIPETFTEHVNLMYDLMLLAYQADMTRVCTFMYGREKSGRTYPEVGVPDAHHPISHHQGRPDVLEKLTKVNTLHMKLFADFVEKLGSTPDGDGHLLDHVAILYGGGMSDSDAHSHVDLPMLVAGGGAGSITGGRHLRYPHETPVTNLHLTLLDKLGVPVEHLGDSTGQLDALSGV